MSSWNRIVVRGIGCSTAASWEGLPRAGQGLVARSSRSAQRDASLARDGTAVLVPQRMNDYLELAMGGATAPSIPARNPSVRTRIFSSAQYRFRVARWM